MPTSCWDMKDDWWRRTRHKPEVNPQPSAMLEGDLYSTSILKVGFERKMLSLRHFSCVTEAVMPEVRGEAWCIVKNGTSHHLTNIISCRQSIISQHRWDRRVRAMEYISKYQYWFELRISEGPAWLLDQDNAPSDWVYTVNRYIHQITSAIWVWRTMISLMVDNMSIESPSIPLSIDTKWVLIWNLGTSHGMKNDDRVSF